MRFEILLTNETDEKIQLQFPSGQQFEITVTDEAGMNKYKYSDGKMFTMAITSKVILPGKTVVWTDEWDMMVNGQKISAGTYTATAELLVMAINGESVNLRPFKVVKTLVIE